jgi:TolB-like protein/DNA-binding winged helix-turn-helix (wHTH) protein
MFPETQTAERIAFGSFELETPSGELFRNGSRIRLSGQPVEVLIILVRNSGKLVSREELRFALWPEDTFVDFDHGLNDCIRRIRDALGDSADRSRFIETLPKKGYRFIAETRTIAPQQDVPASPILTSAVQSPEITASPPGESLPGPLSTSVSKRLRPWVIPTAAMLTAVLVFLGWLLLRSRPQPAAFHSVALLPLTNLSGDSSQDYLTDGVTDELITELAQAASVPVISRTSSMLYKGKQKPMPVIARELGVDAVVEGTLHRSGDQLRMTVHLINGVTDKSLWSQSYDGNMSNARELEIRVAGDLADHIRAPGQQKVQADAPRPVAPEAYEEFLKGQSLWQRDMWASLHHYERAAAIQPDYAAAYGGIAKSKVVLVNGGEIPTFIGFAQIIEAAQKALSLDQRNSDAHASTAWVLLNRDWNWSASEAETLRAIACHPNDSYVYRWYSIKLYLKGKTAESLKQARLALRLDPVSWNSIGYYANLLRQTGNLKEAIKLYQTSVELNPNGYWFEFARALEESGQLDRAAAALEQFYTVRGNPDISAEFKRQYPVLGYKKAAAAARRAFLLRRLHVLEDKRAKNEYVSASSFALTYAGLQDREETLRWLDQAYREHSMAVVILPDEMFDFLRQDPHFISLDKSIPIYR